jgi:hypothetical protein
VSWLRCIFAAASALLFGAAPLLANAEALGTLLLTPEQRRALEAQRRQPAHVQAEQALTHGSTLRIDGAVVSGSRAVAAWIDGQRVWNRQSVGPFTAEVVDRGVLLRQDGRAALYAPVGAQVDALQRRLTQPVVATPHSGQQERR